MSDFDQVNTKLDKISDRQYHMNETLTRNTTSLEEHVRRTNILENKILHTDEQITKIQSFHAKFLGAGKLVTLLGTCLGIVWGIIRLVKGTI